MNNLIKELAEQIGFGWDDKYHWYVGSRQMEKFAALVAAAEREACEKVCDDLVADGMSGTPEWNSGVLNCVAAIRARGEKA